MTHPTRTNFLRVCENRWIICSSYLELRHLHAAPVLVEIVDDAGHGAEEEVEVLPGLVLGHAAPPRLGPPRGEEVQRALVPRHGRAGQARHVQTRLRAETEQ